MKSHYAWLVLIAFFASCGQGNEQPATPVKKEPRAVIYRIDYENDKWIAYFDREIRLPDPNGSLALLLQTLEELPFKVPSSDSLRGKDTLSFASDTALHPLLRTYYDLIYDIKGRLVIYEITPPQESERYVYRYDEQDRIEKIICQSDTLYIKYDVQNRVSDLSYDRVDFESFYRIRYYEKGEITLPPAIQK